jgi:hypothetical protein
MFEFLPKSFSSDGSAFNTPPAAKNDCSGAPAPLPRTASDRRKAAAPQTAPPEARGCHPFAVPAGLGSFLVAVVALAGLLLLAFVAR